MINVEDFVNDLNKRYYIQSVLVPILDGFSLILENNTVLFGALSKEKYMEQYICDGILPEGESFEQHLDIVIDKTKASMKENGFEDVNNSIKFYKDFKNNFFDFKIYLQDFIKDGKILRQYNIYFVDPKSNAFYQVALTTCPYDVKQKEIIETEITLSMDKTMTELMKKIRYREKKIKD